MRTKKLNANKQMTIIKKKKQAKERKKARRKQARKKQPSSRKKALTHTNNTKEQPIRKNQISKIQATHTFLQTIASS
jgi:hypothetical protein